MEKYKNYIKNNMDEFQKEYLLKYEKCKNYLDHNFEKKFKKALQENKEIKKEREKLEQELENVNFDAIWQEINEINTFDFIKSISNYNYTNNKTLFNNLIAVTCKITEDYNYFVKYYDDNFNNMLEKLDFNQYYHPDDKFIQNLTEEIKKISLVSLIITLVESKKFVLYQCYLTEFSNKLFYNHKKNDEKTNLCTLSENLKNKIIHITKIFDKWKISSNLKHEIISKLSEINVIDFLLKKNFKVKTNEERGITKNNSAGSDFCIEYENKNINIEVITLCNPSDEYKLKHNYKTEDDNFYNEYNIPKTEIMMEKGKFQLSILNFFSGSTINNLCKEEGITIETKMAGQIKEKKDKYQKYLGEKYINENDLNIICIFNTMHHYDIINIMNKILYSDDPFYKPKDIKKENPISLNLFSQDKYKIIHGIWLINNDVNINNLFYNYTILEQNKTDWEILKNLRQILKEPLPEYIKQKDKESNNENIYYDANECKQLIQNLKYNSWNYFAKSFEIKNILQKSNLSEEIKTINELNIKQNIYNILANIHDKILLNKYKNQGLKLIDGFRQSLINYSSNYSSFSKNLCSIDNYSPNFENFYKQWEQLYLENYLRNKDNNNECLKFLQLQGINNKIIELDKQIFEENKKIIENLKQNNIYPFIKIIKNNDHDISKGSNLRYYINNIITILKNIKKDYKKILNLIEEFTNCNDDLLKITKKLDEILNEISKVKQLIKNPIMEMELQEISNLNRIISYRANPMELLFINNEYFLPKNSDKDPTLKNLRKYYREY